jgi:hypothetical protein
LKAKKGKIEAEKGRMQATNARMESEKGSMQATRRQKKQPKGIYLSKPIFLFIIRTLSLEMILDCSTTGKPTRSFATERVSLDSV